MSVLLEPELLERIIACRRALHRHPELSWQETRTGELISATLERLGIAHRRGVARTGIVADLPGPAGVPIVALRADMDALPVQEETGLEFASQVPGLMHACGHDGHTSMLLGAAELLARDTQRPAPVRLIFQPAEELGAGAETMVQEGVLDGVGMIFGGHVDRHYPTGVIAISDGVVNASTDSFRIDITGKGGHAARPHECVDAVLVGSLLVTALQTIVSREVDPASPSVVTVGRFQAGTASNVIAEQARLEGTIRAQDAVVRSHLKTSLARMGQAIGQLHTAEIKVSFVDSTPALINEPESASLARLAAGRVVGADSVCTLRIANMGGEDFAYFVEKVPGCYVRFGSQFAGRENFPAHSSRFDFDEQVLGVGARYYHTVAHVAGDYLQQQRR
ncbi:MAG: M20 family metallopeptidase [Gemmataceae bacterium]